jgi:hypothetical protein
MTAPIPLVAEHDSWISVDPLLGCPAKCDYCYLEPLELTAARPDVRATPDEAANALAGFLDARGSDAWGLTKTPIPICLGNYTDMFMTPEGRDFAVEYARRHAARFGAHPLCFVTKARLSKGLLEALRDSGARVLFFLSQSFMAEKEPWIEKGPTCRPDDTARNIALLRETTDFVPIHFWRPLTSRTIPSPEAARRQLRLMREAGCRASVAIGVKGFDHSPAVHDPPADDDAWRGEELLPRHVLSWIWDAAHELHYPVYRNTSCAIAFALGLPETLGAWRDAERELRCLPCMCPDEQRGRCRTVALSDVAPPDGELRELEAKMHLRPRSLRWNAVSHNLVYHGSLTQDMHTVLTHVSGRSVDVDAVSRNRAWAGAIVSGDTLVLDPLRPDDAAIAAVVDRLDHITGFLTTLCPDGDPRPLAFGRGHHVRRVLKAAFTILERDGEHSDDFKRAVARLVWLHDANRWPFAHNAERGRYVQEDDVERFFAAAGVAVSEGESRDLRRIMSRDSSEASDEGALVIAADILAGMVEDPLLAITGLNLHPAEIPEAVTAVLCLPTGRDDLRYMARLNEQFASTRDVAAFVARFDELFSAVFASFLRSLPRVDRGFLQSDRFRQIHTLVRRGFMQHDLFPLNNEKVAHAAILRSAVIDPLIRHFGIDAVARLTTIDEPEAVRIVREHGLLDDDVVPMLYPDLDYLETTEPHRALRGGTRSIP